MERASATHANDGEPPSSNSTGETQPARAAQSRAQWPCAKSALSVWAENRLLGTDWISGSR
jgi:hypothetical protein